MKIIGLVISLFLLFSAISDGAVPNDKEFTKGLKFYNSKNYKAAVTQLQEYVNKKPDPTAYYLIGYSLYKLGKFAEADEYFSQAFLIDPEFSLEKVGLIEKTSKEIVPKKPASPKEPAAVSEAKAAKPEESKPKSSEKENAPSKPAPAASVEQKEKQPVTAAAPAAATPKATTPSKQQPPATTSTSPAPGAKPSPMPKKKSGTSTPPIQVIMPIVGVILLIAAIGLFIFKKRRNKDIS